jgi:hypothetical protein
VKYFSVECSSKGVKYFGGQWGGEVFFYGVQQYKEVF